MKKVSGLTPLLVLSLFVFFNIKTSLSQDEDLSDETCLECHETIDVSGEDIDILEHLESSIHDGISCIDCHSSIVEIPHEEELDPVICGDCHEDEASDYQKHGRLETGQNTDLPKCASCHGTHDILPSSDEESRVSHKNLPQTCGGCHEDIDLTTKHENLYGEAVSLYKSSVHGIATSEGIDTAALCSNCHFVDGSAHKIYDAGDRRSKTNYFNIPSTCGSCHESESSEYWAGIHGKLVASGKTGSPVCTNCHGEHGIVSPSDPRSSVSAARVAEATCSPCHESAYLNERLRGPTGESRNWYDSYHGVKSTEGDITVANCASCHEAHLILPHTDPKSSIFAGNLQQTCGKCHPGISEEMASTPIHQQPGVARTPAAAIVKNIYVVLIAVVVGGMLLYCLIDFRRHIKLSNLKPQIQRMTKNAVWQHTMLIVTFTVLALSGFALRHGDAWWVDILFGWKGGFALRGTIHRVAAVLFLITTIWHVIYLTSKSGRKFLRDMIPGLKDVTQAIQMIRFNLGMASVKPEFGRFSYVEKVEYWALGWGTIIMAVTGLMLWFENTLVAWISEAFLDVMLVIHYYEAWLAMLAVLVWHLYSSVFNPSVYPMNTAWLTGKMEKEKYHEEHAGDMEMSEQKNSIQSEGDTSQSIKPENKS
jgi:cytochrome b subunit of formate dehydrogenase